MTAKRVILPLLPRLLDIPEPILFGMAWGDAGEWASWLRSSGATTGTIKLRLHFVDAFARDNPDPALVCVQDVLTYLGRVGWAPETRKAARSSLRSYFRWAILTGRIQTDPTAMVPAVRVPQGVPRPVPESVLQLAIDQADPRTRLMLLLAAYAGLRRAEVACVHSDDVTDLGLRVHGKGGKVRLIPIHPRLAAPLAEVEGWAFPSSVRRGQSVSPEYVGKRVKAALGGAWTTHTLRHRMASQTFARSRNIRAVQMLLGHSSVSTTERYVACSQDEMAAAIGTLA